jgi:hypothetical protein
MEREEEGEKEMCSCVERQHTVAEVEHGARSLAVSHRDAGARAQARHDQSGFGVRV